MIRERSTAIHLPSPAPLFVHLVLNLVAPEAIADIVTRLSLASIGLWWFLWAIWTLKVVPEPTILHEVKGLSISSAAKLSITELWKTFREIKRFKVVLIYLGAYLLFNDGIQTVMAIAGAFAADTLGIALTFNMMTILIIQFVAAFGAMLFSRISHALSTKKALSVSLVGWSLIVLLGVGFAPLEPAKHSDHDYQLTYNQSSGAYTMQVKPELTDSKLDSIWKEHIGSLHSDDIKLLSPPKAYELQRKVREFSQYSLSFSGGPVPPSGDYGAVGSLHPSNLGDGVLDWWPITIRRLIWEPIGMAVGYQWLLLGMLVGLVMGGSQALARSLFAQLSPQAKSGEFFSFFGFMGRASSVFGPMLYIAVTGMFDARAAVMSILIIIILGTIALKWVNVEEGVRVAREEDKKSGD